MEKAEATAIQFEKLVEEKTAGYPGVIDAGFKKTYFRHGMGGCPHHSGRKIITALLVFDGSRGIDHAWLDSEGGVESRGGHVGFPEKSGAGMQNLIQPGLHIP